MDIVKKAASTLARFARDERGSTAIEYSLVAMLIAIVLIAALTTVGSKLNSQYYNAIAAHL
jgi:pilus assembly protein Flp/PilA